MLRFRNIDVYESIRAHPAGGFTQQASDSPVEVDRVLFDSRPHYLVSLKSTGVVFINPNEIYSFVRVRGDSMNRAKPTPIVGGDYVLLRIADRPEDGQIVAAVFKEDFPEASQSGLKRKARDGLYSESTTPYDIVPLENVERYVGEVIAIAKPLRE
ncbi:MAG: hypothetical protein FJ030_18220 [Chloroflexi bacterium]|nr:hypothetical protein [Chloroflexota bacterium]